MPPTSAGRRIRAAVRRSVPARAGAGTAQRVLAGVLGIAALGAGAVAVFVSTNTVGTGALIAAGLVLTAFGVFGDRIATIEGGGLKLGLEAAAESRYVAAEAAERAGHLEEAASLRTEADRLLSAAGSVASRYEDVRARVPSSWERTSSLEAILQQARDMAGLAAGPAAVKTLYESGSDGNRVAAIAMMQSRPGLATVSALADAIASPRSAFEQYHALRAAETAVAAALPPDDVQELQAVVHKALTTGTLGARDSDRCRLAERILQMGPPAERGDQRDR